MKVSEPRFRFEVIWSVKKACKPGEYDKLYLAMPKIHDFSSKANAEKVFAKSKLDPAVYHIQEYRNLWV